MHHTSQLPQTLMGKPTFEHVQEAVEHICRNPNTSDASFSPLVSNLLSAMFGNKEVHTHFQSEAGKFLLSQLRHTSKITTSRRLRQGIDGMLGQMG